MLVFYDGQIQYYEAILVILVYVVYIVMMYYNDKIEKWVKNKSESKWKTKSFFNYVSN